MAYSDAKRHRPSACAPPGQRWDGWPPAREWSGGAGGGQSPRWNSSRDHTADAREYLQPSPQPSFHPSRERSHDSASCSGRDGASRPAATERQEDWRDVRREDHQVGGALQHDDCSSTWFEDRSGASFQAGVHGLPRGRSPADASGAYRDADRLGAPRSCVLEDDYEDFMTQEEAASKLREVLVKMVPEWQMNEREGKGFFCPFTQRGLGNLLNRGMVSRVEYRGMARALGWTEDPFAQPQHKQTRCKKGICTQLLFLHRHAIDYRGVGAERADSDDDDDFAGDMVCHRVLDEVLRLYTHMSGPGQGLPAPRLPQVFNEMMAWPPVLVLERCSRDFDSEGKLKGRFGDYGVKECAAMYRPNFTGVAVLCFHPELGMTARALYDRVKDLKDSLSGNSCKDVGRANWLTEEKFLPWKTNKPVWAKKIIAWAERVGMTFVNKADKEKEMLQESEERDAETIRIALMEARRAGELEKGKLKLQEEIDRMRKWRDDMSEAMSREKLQFEREHNEKMARMAAEFEVTLNEEQEKRKYELKKVTEQLSFQRERCKALEKGLAKKEQVRQELRQKMAEEAEAAQKRVEELKEEFVGQRRQMEEAANKLKQELKETEQKHAEEKAKDDARLQEENQELTATRELLKESQEAEATYQEQYGTLAYKYNNLKREDAMLVQETLKMLGELKTDLHLIRFMGNPEMQYLMDIGLEDEDRMAFTGWAESFRPFSGPCEAANGLPEFNHVTVFPVRTDPETMQSNYVVNEKSDFVRAFKKKNRRPTPAGVAAVGKTTGEVALEYLRHLKSDFLNSEPPVNGHEQVLMRCCQRYVCYKAGKCDGKRPSGMRTTIETIDGVPGFMARQDRIEMTGELRAKLFIEVKDALIERAHAPARQRPRQR